MCLIPKPEFPRPEKERHAWLNLNGAWDFALFPQGAEDQEQLFAKGRENYDRSITVPFSWVSPLSGVRENVAGIGWYRRGVDFPKKEKVFLCFGAADYKTDVYVNGQHVGSHQGGYTYFEFDVTDCWQGAGDVIEVRCEDYRRETQTYGKQGYGEIQGIWQTVWLESRPEAYIKDFRTVTKMDGRITMDVAVCAPDGAVVEAAFEGVCASAKVQGGKAQIAFTLENPKLWSPESPYLYEGTVALGEDVVHTYFGVREISTGCVGGRGYQWILLNGKPVYLNGTLDQAFNPKGHFTYPSDADMEQEAWRLKRLGLNMVRIHIKPEEPRKLYWMDKLGVMVMADIPCFWGPPLPEARAAYEHELPDTMARDFNHPSIFAWVVFNETWGLLDPVEGSKDKVYKPETQEWVRSIYRWAKELDPTRMVEDNSVCRYDHVETDINTWHFYLNSYEIVRDHIRNVVNNTYPGSAFNFIGENRQGNQPLMNSECGMVWGVDGSAGDSDLAWQYHYMLNEYRLHEKLCGFIFTEFHDVVNEFNGYYRIDDTDKDFGYQDFCRGMTLKDLHAKDFIATDCPPMRTVKAGEKVSIPMVISSFGEENHGKNCTLAWELWYEGLHGRVTCQQGEKALPAFTWGTTALEALEVTMPCDNAAAVLSLYMKDEEGKVISRNFVTFDVRAALAENLIEVAVTSGEAKGFGDQWQALGGEKLCLGGEGEVTYDIALPAGQPLNSLTVHAELSSKRVLQKDKKAKADQQVDMDFMRGYLVDRGAFENSYWMTDESRFPSEVEVLVNGECISTLQLQNDWADARGMLSWHSQPNPRKLDEAGSFGEKQMIQIPSRMLHEIAGAGKLQLTFRVKGQGGLAIYGRHSGRYAHGLVLEMN